MDVSPEGAADAAQHAMPLPASFPDIAAISLFCAVLGMIGDPSVNFRGKP